MYLHICESTKETLLYNVKVSMYYCFREELDVIMKMEKRSVCSSYKTKQVDILKLKVTRTANRQSDTDSDEDSFPDPAAASPVRADMPSTSGISATSASGTLARPLPPVPHKAGKGNLVSVVKITPKLLMRMKMKTSDLCGPGKLLRDVRSRKRNQRKQSIKGKGKERRTQKV